MRNLLIPCLFLMLPSLALAQTSGTITDLGGGMSIYSDTQGNSGTIQDLGGGQSIFYGTQGSGSVQDLGGGMSTYSFTPSTPHRVQPAQPLAPLPFQPLTSGSAPAGMLNQMFNNGMEQMNRR